MVESFLGEIRIFAGTYAPNGWHACDGTLLTVSEYPELFSLIGNAWGGDGRTSFALPDLRCRVPIGSGQDASKNTWVVGDMRGTETVTLTVDELPSHTHSFQVSTSAATEYSPASDMVYAVPSNTATKPDGLYTEVTAREAAMAEGVLDSAGGGGRHANMMPVMDMYYIISMKGQYPSRA